MLLDSMGMVCRQAAIRARNGCAHSNSLGREQFLREAFNVLEENIVISIMALSEHVLFAPTIVL